MSILLETIDLTGLVEVENFHIPIIAETQMADDGSLILYEKELKYKDIFLEGGIDWGWMTFDVLQNIRVMASVIGATYTLNYEGTIKTVRFKTEDIPVISAERLIDTSLVTSTTLYNNVLIKLMEV